MPIILWEHMDTYKIPVWSKVKFENEKQRYTIQASNIHFAVCTKPFNPKNTVLYTVIDWYRNVRWAENLIFWFWAETREQCEDMLDRLTNWDSEVSHRNFRALDLERLDWNYWELYN